MKFEELAGKTVFITGAASGIGQAQAAAFLDAGANVFALDKTEGDLSDMVHHHPHHAAYAIGSVSDKKAVAQAVKEAMSRFGRLDILLNTAGVLDGYAKTLETDETLWDHIITTNLKGIYFVTNAVLPHMLQQHKGIIINMASIAGMIAGGGGAAYTASKHAIVGYTKQLDFDYCREGIRANAIAPGAIKTPMNAADFSGDGKMAEWVANETPAGRWADPSEVANVTLFLASDASDYMHGAILPVDGGWMNK